MKKNKYFFNARIYFLLGLSFLCLNAIAQKFKLPDIPKFDSIYVDSFKGVINKKKYFLNEKRVFEIGYNTGSMLYTPFSNNGGGKEDSCYAYFNGKNLDNYDFYYISKSYIINENYSETSKFFMFSKFDWNNILIERGNYFFIKAMYARTISDYNKYKIGKWIKYDSLGKPVETIDYDNFTINGRPVKFKGRLEVIDSLKILSDKKIIEVYGKKFFFKYVRFNPDRSGYYPYKNLQTEQPGGYSILEQLENGIDFVDLSYDIIIDKERFNIIQFRVSNKGEFLGRTYFPSFKEYFYFTQGLDSLNTGMFHKNVLDWKKIAVNKGLDITSKDFNVKLDFKPTSNYYGELRLVLEQIVKSNSTKHSFTNELEQFYINPWTGEIVEKKDEQGTVEIEGL